MASASPSSSLSTCTNNACSATVRGCGPRPFHRSCSDCGRSEAAPRPAGEARGGGGAELPSSASAA
eukprot:11924500-Alexandrium_andersonii.AAC.1